jgi:hypothetical protein
MIDDYDKRMIERNELIAKTCADVKKMNWFAAGFTSGIVLSVIIMSVTYYIFGG